MLKPKILVTAATGKTGFATAVQLLEKEFPVRAMVRIADKRSETLRRLGAEIVVGNLTDITEVRQALSGVQRAYYCTPFARDALSTGAVFASAAQESRLEMVTVMSQWLADPSSPSVHTRETWLAGNIFNWLPGIATVTVNPGWFADNYRAAGLEVIARAGIMMLPLGEGLNAPPSNEDIARVIAGTLANPAPHLGKTYRPTGPRLLAPQEIADSFGRVTGRKVRYVNGPVWLVPKMLRTAGIPDYQISQLLTYLEEYKRGSYATGAPTGDVLEVSGREPEDFDTIARRYMIGIGNRRLSDSARSLLMLARVLATPGFSMERYEKQQDLNRIRNTRLAGESKEWLASHALSTKTGQPAGSGL
ncbi:MAG TPA: NmrA family NAD(P)-binding protein [Chloroflexia bacterium]|nr:NmrA family NAD(P)-binding protein [Chloroflexia bacterium]